MAESRLVRTRGPQRVVYVHHLQDASEPGNTLAGERIGVSGAVEVLVMIADDGQHQTKRLQGAADVLSGNRMALHYDPFLGGEIRALFQYLVRDRNLAQIVQISATAQSDDLVFLELQMASEITGVFGQPLAVSFGVWITALDAETQRTQYALGGLKFVSEFFELQQRFHSGKQFFGKNGLAQKIVGARLDTADAVFPLSQAGYQDKGNQPGSRILFQLATELISGLARHDHVRKHQVRSAAQNFRFRLGCIEER